MKVTKYNPFQPLVNFGDEFNSLFRNNWPTLFTEPSAVDMYEEEGKLVTDISLPNFKKNEINVSAENDVLEVTAEHKEKEEKKNKRRYFLRESSNQFMRRLPLPEGANASKVVASFKNGVLHLTMPLAKAAIPKKVDIT